MDLKSAGNRDPTSKMSRELGTSIIDLKFTIDLKKCSLRKCRWENVAEKMSDGKVSYWETVDWETVMESVTVCHCRRLQW